MVKCVLAILVEMQITRNFLMKAGKYQFVDSSKSQMFYNCMDLSPSINHPWPLKNTKAKTKTQNKNTLFGLCCNEFWCLIWQLIVFGSYYLTIAIQLSKRNGVGEHASHLPTQLSTCHIFLTKPPLIPIYQNTHFFNALWFWWIYINLLEVCLSVIGQL